MCLYITKAHKKRLNKLKQQTWSFLLAGALCSVALDQTESCRGVKKSHSYLRRVENVCKKDFQIFHTAILGF